MLELYCNIKKGNEPYDFGSSKDKNDKYYGYNKSKLDFNGKIVEYSEVFDLIINNFLYNLLSFIKIFNLKKKDLNK